MDLNELKTKYGLEAQKEQETEKPKFGRKRAWLDDTSTINSNKAENKIVDKIEKNDLKNIEKIVKPDEPKDLNSYSIQNNLENNYLKNIEAPAVPFERIVGLQKEALLVIYDHCQLIGSRTTRPLGIAFFVERLKTSQLNAHNVLNELVKKKAIIRADYQRGRGGWSKWEIVEATWNEINLNSYSIIKNDRKNIEQNIENGSYSSSSNNLKTNTIQEAEPINFNIPANLSAMGIGNRQLVVIVRDNFLTAEEVQQSLDHYSHDITKSLTKKSTNFFFGILRNKTPYISSHYAQEEARAVQAEIARIKELQQQREELKNLKLQEEYEQFKANNPAFLDELKKSNQFLAKSPSGLLDKMGFEEWKKQSGYNT